MKNDDSKNQNLKASETSTPRDVIFWGKAKIVTGYFIIISIVSTFIIALIYSMGWKLAILTIILAIGIPSMLQLAKNLITGKI